MSCLVTEQAMLYAGNCQAFRIIVEGVGPKDSGILNQLENLERLASEINCPYAVEKVAEAKAALVDAVKWLDFEFCGATAGGPLQ